MSQGAADGNDRGTVLEPVAHLRGDSPRPVAEPAGTRLEPRPGAESPAGPPQVAYRPAIRPLVPRLILLDDGEYAAGEILRLRDSVIRIGRTEGDVRLPHDPLVSARHAEIVREGSTRPHRWLLRDLGSSNGTFVRCGRTILDPKRLVLLGSRRFRFHPPVPPAAPAAASAGTLAVDVAGLQPSWPALVETGQVAGGLELPLTGPDLPLGRPGAGNAVEIDDPLLAPRHARVLRDLSGCWVLEALPSLNGVWAQVAAVHLSARCQFQIGEQRFLFIVDEG